MRRKWLWALGLALIALIIQACAPQFEAEEDCGFIQNSYGERVSWNNKLPISIFIHSSVREHGGSEAVHAIERALLTLEESLGYQKSALFVLKNEVGGPPTPRQDGASVVYWLTTWEAGQELEQARTTLHYTGNQIKEFDIMINGKDMKSINTRSTIMMGELDLESLMLHELNHGLGQAHQADDKDSIMITQLPRGLDRRELKNLDVENLRCEY